MNWWFHLPLCRFALAHEGHTCRRRVILEYFQENPCSRSSEDECCDVCSGDHDMMDYQREMISIIKAAQEIPGYGEVKVREFLLVASYLHTCILTNKAFFLGMYAACPMDQRFLYRSHSASVASTSRSRDIWNWKRVCTQRGRLEKVD